LFSINEQNVNRIYLSSFFW